MNITLSYPTPVQQNYIAVPRPLCPKLKHYIEDLLNPTQTHQTVLRDRNGFQLLIREGLSAKVYVPRWPTLNCICNPLGPLRVDPHPNRIKERPRGISEIYGGLFTRFRDDFCEPYLDDVIVYSKSFKELIEHVRQVLRRLRENGVKLRANMCNLFQKRGVLCWNVSVEGYRTSSENAKAMEEFRTHEPQNVGDVRTLPGLFGYYRRYVENFSRIAKPICDLLQISAISTKSDMFHLKPTKRKQSKKISGFIQNSSYVGRKKHRKALNVLTSPPVLATNRLFTTFYFTY